MKITVSVIIPTKDRPRQLRKCLDSLGKQTWAPKEILVIDNGNSAKAQKILKRYKPFLPIRHVPNPNIGISASRNKGLKLATGKYAAFIDDDCVAQTDWLEIIGRTTQKKQGVIQGRTKENFKNLYSLVNILPLKEYINFELWRSRAKRIQFSKGMGLYPIHYLDPKNIALPLQAVRQKNLFFDERFRYGYEEVDWILRAQESDVKVYYCSKMVVSHKNELSFFSFLKKHFLRGRSKRLFDRKWGRSENPFLKYQLLFQGTKGERYFSDILGRKMRFRQQLLSKLSRQARMAVSLLEDFGRLALALGQWIQ